MKLKLTKETKEKQRGGGFWKMSQQFNRTNQLKPKQMVYSPHTDGIWEIFPGLKL